MIPNDESREDELFRALFAALDEDAVPPDPELRDRLRCESAGIFEKGWPGLQRPE